MRQRYYCLFLSAGWGLRSHPPWAWDRLWLPQEQSRHSGFDLYHCLPLSQLTPVHLGHCTSSWYLYPSLHLPIGTSWFNKCNHFLQPPPKESYIEKCFFLEIRLILRIGHCYSLKLHQFIAFTVLRLLLCPQSEPDFDLFFWFGKTLDTISICPGVGLRALLSISVQGLSQLLFPIGLFLLSLSLALDM